MNSQQLADLLFAMVKNAKLKDRSSMVQLFGIIFHEEITYFGCLKIIEKSGLKRSYIKLLSEAIKLSEYVMVKP